MARAALICLACLGFAACVFAPKAALATFNWADIQPIVEPLTYRELLGKKCGAPDMAVKAAFMKDLKAAGASAVILAQAKTESTRIEQAERDTLNEYVCTVELFESTEKNAAAAQAAWDALKQPKS